MITMKLTSKMMTIHRKDRHWCWLSLLATLIIIPLSAAAPEFKSISNYKLDFDTPFNLIPMLMTHDTATGYLGEDDIYFHPKTPQEKLVAWAKTQRATVTQQLQCGARAFDMRPYLEGDGTLLMRHGTVVIKEAFFGKMMKEMVDWAHENTDELIVAEVFGCNGDEEVYGPNATDISDACFDQTVKELEDLGIPYIREGCEAGTHQDGLKGWTYETALEKSSLLDSTGKAGHVIAIWSGCFDSNYDGSLACSGYEYESRPDVSTRYLCHLNGQNPTYPFERTMADLDRVSLQGPNMTSGNLWQMQALWQVSEAAVVVGTGYFSSILYDIQQSRINRKSFERLADPDTRWEQVNLFEVDDVCDQGSLIHQALFPSTFEGVAADYPDNIVIDPTTPAQSILNGDSVEYPDLNQKATGRRFKDTIEIRRRHKNTRWGNTNDIRDLFSDDDELKDDYIIGIFGTTILIICLTFLWTVVMLYLKFSGKLGILSGVPPKLPAKSDHEGEEEEYEVAVFKIGTRMKYIRVLVIICGVLIIVFSGLLIGLGFANLEDSLQTAESSIPEIREIFDAANYATNEVLLQTNATAAARVNMINSLVSYCDLDGSNLEDGSNETISNVFDSEFGEDAKDQLILLNNSLDNNTWLYDNLYKMNQSLADLSGDLHDIESDINDLEHHWLFIVATTFIVLLDVVVLVFMYGVYSAWKNDMPRLFKDCASKYVLPLFIFLLVVAIITSLGGLLGATLAADFCIDTPDNQIIDILNVSEPFNEFVVYYVRECDPGFRPDWATDIFIFLQYYLNLIDKALVMISLTDPADVPCSNATAVLNSISNLQEQYNIYTNLLYDFSYSLRCEEINEIYSLIAHDATCRSGFGALYEVFAFMVTIFALSMTMITFRVAWYETEEEQDRMEDEGDDEEEAEIQEQAGAYTETHTKEKEGEKRDSFEDEMLEEENVKA